MKKKEEVTITFYAAECGEFHDLGEMCIRDRDQHTGTYSRQKVSAQAYCAAYVIAKRYGCLLYTSWENCILPSVPESIPTEWKLCSTGTGQQ